MSVYAISDLHLSIGNKEKSMEFFGDKWKDYEKRIKENWEKTVKENDTVIIPGDISWSLKLEDSIEDFKFLNDLPGTKIILKGNHDFYFSTVKKVKEFFQKQGFDTIKILHNNSYIVENLAICGSRGWTNGADKENKCDDAKIFKRELGRLKLSLDSVKDKGKDILVAMHYPVTNIEFRKLMKEYNVKQCIYGHLHGEGHYMVFEGDIDGIKYTMVSGDYTDFKLKKLN